MNANAGDDGSPKRRTVGVRSITAAEVWPLVMVIPPTIGTTSVWSSIDQISRVILIRESDCRGSNVES